MLYQNAKSQDLFPMQSFADAASTPSIPIKISDMLVEVCSRRDVQAFIEINHYSRSINGCISDYCFRLMHKGEIIGAAFFGRMAMAGQWKKYGAVETDVIELRRLCCVDATPKNTESFFIGAMLRWLKKNTLHKAVVSYADAEHGHIGTIYKASNFKYLGCAAGAKVILYNQKTYHDKTIRTKYNGKLKPFAQKIKDALESGEAVYKTTAGKHIYVYSLT
jgi:hypothetical protein